MLLHNLINISNPLIKSLKIYKIYKNYIYNIQVKMELLAKMNAKMDQGYKLTNYYCQFCNGVTLTKPNAANDKTQSMVYCPKCNKQYVPPKDNQDEVDEYQQYYNDLSTKSVAKEQDRNQKKYQIKQIISPQKQSPKNTNQKQIKSITQSAQSAQNLESVDPIEQQYEQFINTFNSITKTQSQKKSEQVSKKIGEKLIGGWAMMQSACQQCNVPLMKSKKGNLICCGCDKDFSTINKAQKESVKKQGKKQEKKQSTFNNKISELKQKREIKNQQVMYQSPNTKPKVQPKTQKPQSSHQNQQSYSQPNKKIQRIIQKTLTFLESELDSAIKNNDLEHVDRVIKSLKNTKQLL